MILTSDLETEERTITYREGATRADIESNIPDSGSCAFHFPFTRFRRGKRQARGRLSDIAFNICPCDTFMVENSS